MVGKNAVVEECFDKHWEDDTMALIRLETWKHLGDDKSEQACRNNLIAVRTHLEKCVNDINKGLTDIQLENFQWVQWGKRVITNPNVCLDPSDDDCRSADYWVFGFAIGPEDAPNRICIATHADVVPATKSDDGLWKPFVPEVKKDVDYPTGIYKKQDFLVGRGAVDNKGQVCSALAVARAIAKTYNGTGALKNTRIEFISDSSEETEMGVPYYTKWREGQRGGRRPFDLGIVYDGGWMIVAEKGSERPAFTVDEILTKQALVLPPLYLESLLTPEGTSINTIPDYATAVIKGESTILEDFYSKLPDAYKSCGWGSVTDHKCGWENPEEFEPSVLSKCELVRDENGVPSYVELIADVRGAQHGSAAAANQANGLACLGYFLGGLVEDGTLGVTPYGALAHFMRWEFSTNVCGEDRPDALFREDALFGKGVRNGTTFALTNMGRVADPDGVEDGKIRLKLDIRYATGHHPGDYQPGSDHEGLLPGLKSDLDKIFKEEVKKFLADKPSYPRIHAYSKTKYPPDIRNSAKNRSCKILKAAYKEEMGHDPPEVPIGGSTDAKGNPCMVAVGLFGADAGHPVNVHGVFEGCPIKDIRVATKIIYQAVVKAIEDPPPLTIFPNAETMKRESESSRRMLEFLAKDSDCGCNC